MSKINKNEYKKNSRSDLYDVSLLWRKLLLPKCEKNNFLLGPPPSLYTSHKIILKYVKMSNCKIYKLKFKIKFIKETEPKKNTINIKIKFTK